MTDILAEAESRIEGYEDPGAERARLNRLAGDLGRVGIGERSAETNALYKHLLATSNDLFAIREAWDAHQVALRGNDFYTELKHDLLRLGTGVKEAATSYGASDVRPALEYLNTQLGELVATVRDLDRTLGQVSSTEQAIRGSEAVVVAWRDLTELCDRYEEIRRAQNRITLTLTRSATEGQINLALKTTGRLRNAFDFESYWVDARRRRRNRPEWAYARPFFEWLDSPAPATWSRQTSEIWPTDDRQAYIRWMAKTAAPWVPTLEQLTDAEQAITAMSKSMSTIGDLRDALDAHDTYYANRGVKPVRSIDVRAIRAQLPNRRAVAVEA